MNLAHLSQERTGHLHRADTRQGACRVHHAVCCSSSRALRKKAMTSSTARRVGWPGASIRSPVKTECGAFPCAFMPAGLAALSGNSVPANAVPKAVRRVWKRDARQMVSPSNR